MTDKEKLEKLWEQVLNLEMFMRSMKLLMDEEKNTINVKECVNEIFYKIMVMQDTLKNGNEEED